MRTDGRLTGLAEDITKERLEIQKVEYERDYDALTNLLNRRAFHRTMDELFTTKKEKLGYAALVMLDLDNLKYINDTYGHDFGDEYIRRPILSPARFGRGRLVSGGQRGL